MKSYVCLSCNYNYVQAIGDPASNIAPDTRFEDLPDDWVCPVCGIHMIEIKNKIQI